MDPEIEPTALASRSCQRATAHTPALTDAELIRLARGLDPAWQRHEDRLVRTFRSATFGAAFTLATRIALLAETQGHHPRLEVSWGRLVVAWTTDAIGALSLNDVIMAAKVDRLVARGLGLEEG